MRAAGRFGACVLAGLLAGSRVVAEPPRYAQSPDAFVSVKGERAFLLGYRDALEAWTPPVQVLRDYRLSFIVDGKVAPVPAAPLLRRVERRPDEATRVYIGPDFVVRERLFSPRDQAGLIIDYEVEGRPEVAIAVAFTPVLDLMWPGGLGGQSLSWEGSRRAYTIAEPLDGFRATIGSPDAVAHETTANEARRGEAAGAALRLAPAPGGDGVRRATLYIALERPGADDALERLRAAGPALRLDAAAHVDAVLAGSVELHTPDRAVDAAFASAELALDQAWACNARIGCGVLAGFGPSRPARRPQYAWFFAGDGLVAVEGMVAAGQFERAREELDFIAKYQDPKTGAIWHEISQSAGWIDWRNRYPYMFVHVDITLQYLATLIDYERATGDEAWIRRHWVGIAAAWSAARALADPATGLPRIPPGKEGQNEQDALRDDIRLSSLFLSAADAFAEIAERERRPDLAAEARNMARRARSAMRADWDPANGFFLEGHTPDGAPVHGARSDAIGVLTQDVFSADERDRALERISTPTLLTDWGVRGLASDDPRYDPNQYSNGSVWGLGTASVAATLWRLHQPLAAWAAWRNLPAWNTLDSAGHIPEVLAGDLFHEEREAVPEQTWSSAGFVSSLVRGLLGLEADAGARRLSFAPHLPPSWDRVTVQRVRVGDSRLDLDLESTTRGFALRVTNDGPPIAFTFSPMLPLGARRGVATVDGAPAAVTLEAHPEDAHARLTFTARTGTTTVAIAHAAGAWLSVAGEPPRPGDAPRDPIIAKAVRTGDRLDLETWVRADTGGEIDVGGDVDVLGVEGAALSARSGGSRLVVPARADATGYRRVPIRMRLRDASAGSPAP